MLTAREDEPDSRGFKFARQRPTNCGACFNVFMTGEKKIEWS